MATVAILMDRTFDDASFQLALERLHRAGHGVVLVGPRAGEQLQGVLGNVSATVDRAVDDVSAGEFDGLLIPLGLPLNHLRTHERLLNFVRDIYALGKPLGVNREEGWLMVAADRPGKSLVSWPALKRRLFVDPPLPALDEPLHDLVEAGSDGSGGAALLDALLSQLEPPVAEGALHRVHPGADAAAEYPLGEPPVESVHPVD